MYKSKSIPWTKTRIKNRIKLSEFFFAHAQQKKRIGSATLNKNTNKDVKSKELEQTRNSHDRKCRRRSEGTSPDPPVLYFQICQLLNEN